MRGTCVIPVVLTLIFTLGSCGGGHRGEQKLIIFNAGSLSVPVKELSEAFEKVNTGVRVLPEAAGSVHSARKITDLGRMCDIILSADHFIVSSMLIPEYASWNIRFATNEMVIAYRPEAPFASEINAENWPDILLRDDVIFGRSDPDADPCGYRTIFVAKLAEEYYVRAGLGDSLLGKNKEYIRPKEVDLVALAETEVIDYMFQYRSVAIQHGFLYLELPDEINLSTPDMDDRYSSVSYMIPGETPGSLTEVRGSHISYSGTVLDRAPQKELAMRFFAFMLGDEGKAIFREAGQEPLEPALADDITNIPEALRCFLIPMAE
jgi:molybdate/tungstate transport system substrate-binding protein